jgi:hypothetical protein
VEKPKIRLQFDFGPESVKELDELRNEVGASSRVAVVKEALGLLQWVTQAYKEGWQLIVERGDEQRVVVLPFARRGRAAGTLR